MNYVTKILKTSLILIIVVLITLLSASVLLQNRISGIILETINKHISAELEIGSARLSFIRNFPKGSLELKNVLVYSSRDFISSDLNVTGFDTLLFSRSVSVTFHLPDILKGNYHIETISARTGKINLFDGGPGNANYDITSARGNDTSSTIIDLEKILLSDMTAVYINPSAGFMICGLVKNGRLKSRINGKDIRFSTESALLIDSVRIKETIIRHPFEAMIDLRLLSAEEGVLFEKSRLTIDDYDFTLEGSVSRDNDYNLIIRGNNINISGFTRYFPEKIQNSITAYNPSGRMLLNMSVKGQVTKTRNPHIEAAFTLNNGCIKIEGSRLSAENITFHGIYTNGERNSAATNSLNLDDIKFRLGSTDYSGSFRTTNFNMPVTEITVNGKVRPAEIIEFFQISSVSSAGGIIDTDLKLVTGHRLRDSLTIEDFFDMKYQGTLTFKNFSLRLAKNELAFGNVNGTVQISDAWRTEGLTFEYKEQKIAVKGEYRNLPGWLAGKPVTLHAKGDVSFSLFKPGSFMPAAGGSQSQTLNFPDNMQLDLNFKIDSLSYKTLSSSKVSGSLVYKPRLLTFNSLNLNILDGFISGKGFVVQNKNGAFVSRGDFDIQHIDVKKAFHTFNNFGQKFILEENLSGQLSGSVSMLLPLDGKFSPKTKELTAEGKYILENGALINFEPVRKLSSFIELSELENIHFDRLENDFFIRNNALVIPQMEVNSSAADLSVKGRHDFSNNYEYHVKILLSELLSKKRKTVRKPVTEFGAVKDDGLGRTSMLLKMENRGDDVKVSYDLKEVGQEINRNVKTEKQNLRTILNEEYGWYKNEPKQPADQPSEKKSRFMVTWEEDDSIAPVIKEENEKGLRNLLRKK